MKKMATFFDEGDKGIVCRLCPRHCFLSDGQIGFCKTRKNENGILYTINYGEISSIAMDPIEKKPLFHFRPGSKILSIGSWGCNFSCGFCQNWEISQVKPAVKTVTPSQIVEIAKTRNSNGIAYTYNEPIVSYEFVLDTSRIAHKEGLYNVLVTNGYIEFEPLNVLLQSIDAMNIDLKGSNEEFYKEMGGSYSHVLKVIETAKNRGVHVEVTTLVIPTKNDDEKELIQEFKDLAKIDKDIPLHLSRYFPAYKYEIPPTPIETLEKLYSIAKEYLNFVYIGNVFEPRYESTFCPDCGTQLIYREGYNVDIKNITEGGYCKVCGRKVVVT
ncbi:radical SAM protein [Thermosipho africanus H17ap60334]|uniref:Radical SAM domain protein n=1 Tax=Thermosipho africanus (strain TCF52B) TaxID=484019 RepID=B7ICU0_THEAB|nr:AmmeMemoRadiSam system radical SAM enzyme [Thermosipho africanus]ACJ75817.1 radical SAM domain protein [Thermosipho africanus TCF52B]EKF49830.1 radical SAM protein [Thermosipho africanus H17ap60334]MDK2900183.1 pyruvate formate lyase activating enzyme [Thermosipho sp. (in: thermotogales)]RDI91874.1 radical SAM protein [Thermosipho africanus Ob7]